MRYQPEPGSNHGAMSFTFWPWSRWRSDLFAGAYPSGQLTWTDLQSVDLTRCYADAAGFQRCGSNSSMRLAGWVGSRSNTFLMYA